MRTTVTLDDDVAAQLRSVARERGVSFKEALNSMVRAGLGAEHGVSQAFRQRTYRMGLRPGVGLEKALQLAAALEDEETIRKLELRK